MKRGTQGKTALITGVTGQDGSYLAELLLEKGYRVHGLRRRSSIPKIDRVEHMYADPHVDEKGLNLHYGDITDSSSLTRILSEVQPDEVYNLAAQSQVRVSFETPEYTANVDALGPLRLLEAIRTVGLGDSVRVYQASTSELFGKAQESPQDEDTPFHPRSPYGAAKLYAYWVTVNYREAYSMFISNGILFNHESPRRDPTFLTRKVTSSIAKMLAGEMDRLYLGNLNAERDWGYAPEYVESMWLMLQQDEPDDYVVATGESHSVRDFVEECFRLLGVEIDWEGTGVDERGVAAGTGRTLVEVDPWYFRPTEVDHLVGDYSKARERLGWEPRTNFSQLVEIMLEADVQRGGMEDLDEASKVARRTF